MDSARHAERAQQSLLGSGNVRHYWDGDLGNVLHGLRVRLWKMRCGGHLLAFARDFRGTPGAQSLKFAQGLVKGALEAGLLACEYRQSLVAAVGYQPQMAGVVPVGCVYLVEAGFD